RSAAGPSPSRRVAEDRGAGWPPSPGGRARDLSAPGRGRLHAIPRPALLGARRYSHRGHPICGEMPDLAGRAQDCGDRATRPGPGCGCTSRPGGSAGMVRLKDGRISVSRRAIIGARWAMGLAIVGVLLMRFDFGGVVEALRHANMELAVPAIAGLVAMHLVGAATWRPLSARIAGIRLSWWEAVRTYYAAQGIGGLTPGNIGADVYRVYVAGDATGWRRALLPVVVQRVTSSIALAVIATLALFTLPRPSQIAGLVTGSAILLALASSAVVLVIWRPGRRSRLARRAGEPLGPVSDRPSARRLVGPAWLGIGL